MANLVLNDYQGAAGDPILLSGKGTLTIDAGDLDAQVKVDAGVNKLTLKASAIYGIRISNSKTLKIGGGVSYDALKRRAVLSTKLEFQFAEGVSVTVETKGKGVSVSGKVKIKF